MDRLGLHPIEVLLGQNQDPYCYIHQVLCAGPSYEHSLGVTDHVGTDAAIFVETR